MAIGKWQRTHLHCIEKDFPDSAFHMQICSDSGIRIPLHGATVIHNSIQNFSLSWTIIFDLLMTWLSCLNHLQNTFCLFLLIILYFSISFLFDHKGMSALDDKMTHLKQDMTFYKITKIVGALWLAERSVCMRVCKHGCDVRCFAFRALITQARIWKRFSDQNSTSSLYLPIPSSAETWKIFTKKLCQLFVA